MYYYDINKNFQIISEYNLDSLLDSPDDGQPFVKNKQRAATRRKSKTKALRKQKLAKSCLGEYYVDRPLHSFDKGKIHCSCPLCSIKTRSGNYTRQDSKRIAAMKDSLKENL
jgi:hypothetical protein